MSEIQNNLPKYSPDMGERDVQLLESFIEDGLPNIATFTPDKIKIAIDLYLNGSTYGEISNKLNIKKNIILYFFYKHKMYETKQKFYEELSASLDSKLAVSGVRRLDFLLTVMNALESYYRDSLDTYLVTKNKKALESIDFENLKTYMRIAEVVTKIMNPSDDKKTGSMGLNLPNGGILKKIDDNTVEVSPLNSQIAETKLGEILRTLAKIKEEKGEE